MSLTAAAQMWSRTDLTPGDMDVAELYDGFDDVVQKAYRAKVVIVSPSLLMLAINVVQQIQKDARMREAADKIHAEVGHLMDDLKRLNERVAKLVTGRQAMAQEYGPADLSPTFRSNGTAEPNNAEYAALASNGFADYALDVGGLVAKPRRFTLAEVRALPSRTR